MFARALICQFVMDRGTQERNYVKGIAWSSDKSHYPLRLPTTETCIQQMKG